MPLAELLPIVGALCAPAFFLIFALASLGAPLLGMVCLLVAQVRSTQHPEAYARRTLRMALSCAIPALLVFATAIALLAFRAPWFWDWLQAAPVAPALLLVVILAYCASLLTLRLARPSSRQRRQSGPLGQTFILALLSVIIIALSLMLAANLQDQAQAVLRAPMDSGIGVAQLIILNISTLPSMFWTALAASIALSAACAGAMSLEYLLLLRDREPFGRDALAHMLRMAARATLRSTLVSVAFLPVLWTHLPEMPALPGGEQAARLLLGATAATCLLLCITSGVVARSTRPWSHSLAIHANMLFLWLGLTALSAVALLCFYAV